MNEQWWNTGDDEFMRFYSVDEYRIRGVSSVWLDFIGI
jgi:hypothetical protein